MEADSIFHVNESFIDALNVVMDGRQGTVSACGLEYDETEGGLSLVWRVVLGGQVVKMKAGEVRIGIGVSSGGF